VKLKDWNPTPASLNSEDFITRFEKDLKEAIRLDNLKPLTYTSLTPVQKSTLNELKHSKEFIIVPNDRNLGPAIMNRDT
jgi:hypothetical protein